VRPDLLARLDAVGERVAAAGAGAAPFDTLVTARGGPGRVVIDGRERWMFGANDYLALGRHPEVLAAASAALQAWGPGTTGSRVANGTTPLHRGLEGAFAEAYGLPAALVFTTGHQANLSVVAGLAGPDDAVLLDAECHASLFDGARLSGADTFTFRHGDAADLDRRLQRVDRPCLVAVEGLYSISGDVAELGPLVEVVERHGARLLVDEAHSFGVFGPRGLGVAAAQGLLGRVDVLVGTFSKSLGGVGGFAVSRHPALAALHYLARAYLFTASGAPPSVAAAAEALALCLGPEGERRRERLRHNTATLRADLRGRGLDVRGDSPVIRLVVGAPEAAVAAWRAALQDGVYVNLVLPPACRRHECGLRVSVSAEHDDEALSTAALALGRALEATCRASS
jgi:8-amino-7-oxononanoate synthase